MGRKVGNISLFGGLFRRKDKTKELEQQDPGVTGQPTEMLRVTEETLPKTQTSEALVPQESAQTSPLPRISDSMDMAAGGNDEKEITLGKSRDATNGFEQEDSRESDSRLMIRGDMMKTILLDPKEAPMRQKQRPETCNEGNAIEDIPSTILIDSDEEEDELEQVQVATPTQDTFQAILTDSTSVTPPASPMVRAVQESPGIGSEKEPSDTALSAERWQNDSLVHKVEPTAHDTLSVNPHAQALTRFIAACDTPMTIVIEGKAGSGRTTLMQMTSAALAQMPVGILWFDAWEFDQIPSKAHLSVLLMTELALLVAGPGLGEEPANEHSPRDRLPLQRDLDELALALAPPSSPECSDGGLKTPRIGGGKFFSAGDHSRHLFANVRSGLGRLVTRFLKNSQKEKIVVFVDNLDLVHPLNAAEFMEHVAGLLAIPGCVFVMGFDPELIESAFEKRGLDRATARRLLEKLVRVSYKTPVARLSLDSYLDELLRRARITVDRRDISIFRALVMDSIGPNPRAIRNLIDRLALLSCVHESWGHASYFHSQESQGRVLTRLLFGLICLETSFPDFWNLVLSEFLQDDENESNHRGMVALLQTPSQRGEGLECALRMAMGAGGAVAGEIGFDGAFFTKLARFLETFRSALDCDEQGDPTEESLLCLYRGIRIMTTLSGTGAPVIDDPLRDEITFYCRHIMAFLRARGTIVPQVQNKWAHGTSEGARYHYSLWFKPEGPKSAWGPDRLFYRLTFSLEGKTYVLLSLHCAVDKLVERHVSRLRIDGLKHLDALKEAKFVYLDTDENGWVTVEKKLGEDMEPTPSEDVATIAGELMKLIEVTAHYFDIDLSEQTITLSEKLEKPKQEIPTPCPKCGKKELRIISRTPDGIIHLRCGACNHPLRTRPSPTAGKSG